MAGKSAKTLLAFLDEPITEKHKGVVDFTVNKIGGIPDFPIKLTTEKTKCPLCQLQRPLIVQIYAPLENFSYHRTLYLFACINPNCWNQQESWICLRTQIFAENISTNVEVKDSENTTENNFGVTDWCEDADNWDDDNANVEKNGNSIGSSENDEESCSFDEPLTIEMGNMVLDEKNANCDYQGGGATGNLYSPSATAELEGDEGEIVTVDTPTQPQVDITSLLHEVPPSHYHNNSHFIPYFLSVYEETQASHCDEHIKELLSEYKRKNEGVRLSATNDDLGCNVEEKYEKSSPVHGDRMFHYFLRKVQENPGQLLRYSRDVGQPLLLYPLQGVPKRCENCQGEMVFEFQVLPTIIPQLKLNVDEQLFCRLEFGTVLVFTCKRSCFSLLDNILEEFVVVQQEKI